MYRIIGGVLVSIGAGALASGAGVLLHGYRTQRVKSAEAKAPAAPPLSDKTFVVFDLTTHYLNERHPTYHMLDQLHARVVDQTERDLFRTLVTMVDNVAGTQALMARVLQRKPYGPEDGRLLREIPDAAVKLASRALSVGKALADYSQETKPSETKLKDMNQILADLEAVLQVTTQNMQADLAAVPTAALVTPDHPAPTA